MPKHAGWTAALLRALPDPGDGSRRECVDRQLHVTPAPTWPHQEVIVRLVLHLAP
ncbi:MAG: hypothetical protein NW201_01490 [Gemmatimonadales bacterium]|nr:hypothetical protein [Gemmatimonadales bacterium]